MPRYFTHYWSNQTWVQEEKYNSENDLLNHIAGNLFGERNIEVGDEIYVVTIIKGKLYLCGKIIVGRICDVDEAAKHLNYKIEDLWEASEHIIASAATSTNFHLEVPLETTQRLRFKSGKNLKSLLFSSPNHLDQQTLRGVRELNPESALELDKFLPSIIELSDLQFSNHQYPLSNDEIFPLDAEGQKIEMGGDFNAENPEDARRRITASIVQRQGQPEFRRKLLSSYGGRCPITDCDVESAIEAAHIIPYQGPETNHPTNGLPLRADIHTLFDLHLLSIRPDTYDVVISPELIDTCYKDLASRKLTLPQDQKAAPNRNSLSKHHETFLRKCKSYQLPAT